MKRTIANSLAAFALAAVPAAAAELPMDGRSLGGVVRAAPGMESQRLGSLRENEPIVIVKKTGVEMNGYSWFQIKFRGRTGYQWGGIMCASAPMEGIFQTCQ